ncbi:MAG: PfkB family carbohydrate kinase [Pseudomonadota bacterium]
MTALGKGILCVGAAHWDVIARADGPVRIGDDLPGRIEQRPGGVALNVAIGLAKRGRPARLSSVVGDDDAGSSLIGHAEAAGVDCTQVVRIANRVTSRYLAIEDGDGSLIAAIADTALLDQKAEGLPGQLEQAIRNADALLLEANLSASVMSDLARFATAASVEIIANPVSPAKAGRLKGLIAQQHRPTIIGNLQEANAILGVDARNSEEAAIGLRRAGARVALVSDGPRTVALASEKGAVSLVPARLTDRFSVTGAGDALISAFLACPERHASPKIALERALQAAQDHMTMHR